MTSLAPPVARRPGRAGSDTLALVSRSLRRLPRQPDTLIISVALPIVLLLLFVYVFGGAIADGGRRDYLTYAVPGIIVLAAGWGATQTAVAVAGDLKAGIVDRFRSMPVRGSAVLTGHVAASLAANAVATALVIGIALAIGFRPDAGVGGWIAAVGLLALYVLALTWVSIALGLLAGGPEAASGLTFLILFLPYVSSGFVPTDTMPGALRAFADHQPLTPVIETMRGLLVGGGADGGEAVRAVVWCVGILLAGYLAAALLFRRRTSR
ncbi:ABC transporter permease [Frankia nepalensis]|uniref:Transport permease protein n=1 Tax=Frankia nepalensis TaxID=1836974 RepID=A0A937RPR5_9ACTN|nr:ABC transporter permease [Frankia nepalensis]MBL7501180.1 ABC transporter permease [Frankia nepalensis]MBL7512618.1 ABC transporter permease [Frankia nepalensis]MBL7632674.1 ABC transporter permease [Frankia nepalensis]